MSMVKSTRQERPRPRDKAKTKEGLLLAIQRVQNKGLTMSISAVASEAEVDPSLIHHVYPDIAERVRKLIGRSTREQRESIQSELSETKRENRELREEIDALHRDINRLASINLSLEQELTELRAAWSGKLVPLPKTGDPT